MIHILWLKVWAILKIRVNIAGGSATLPSGLPAPYYLGFKGCIDKVKVSRKPLDMLNRLGNDHSPVQFCHDNDVWPMWSYLLVSANKKRLLGTMCRRTCPILNPAKTMICDLLCQLREKKKFWGTLWLDAVQWKSSSWTTLSVLSVQPFTLTKSCEFWGRIS